MSTTLPPAIATRLRRLPSGLRDHIHRARDVAGELAEAHRLDAGKVDIGTAAHDLARSLKVDALLEEARRGGLAVHPVVLRVPLLLHGPVAAMWLETEDGLEDRDVLDAVRHHSTGHGQMGPTAKAVYLADKLDPEKVRRWPELEAVAELAMVSLDRAILEYLDRELKYLLGQGLLIHPASIDLRNALMAELGDADSTA